MRVRQNLINPTAVLMVFCFGIAACSSDDTSSTKPASAEEMFAKDCGACHGEGGRGPTLADMRALSEEELRSAIQQHPTAGQIPERLPAARVDDLIKYIDQ